MSRQDNIPFPISSNHNVWGPEEISLAKSYDKDFKITIMNIFKNIEEYTNSCLHKIIKMQKVKWIMNKFKDMNIELEWLMKTHTEIKLEIKF